MTPAQVAAVIAEAKSWLKTPYVHHARVKGHGVDCLMLLIEVYGACGIIENFDPGFYTAEWFLHRDEERYMGGLERYCDRTEVGEPGDIALYRYGRTASHGAIIVEPGIVVHAFREARQVELCDMIVLKPRLDSFWRAR